MSGYHAIVICRCIRSEYGCGGLLMLSLWKCLSDSFRIEDWLEGVLWFVIVVVVVIAMTGILLWSLPWSSFA